MQSEKEPLLDGDATVVKAYPRRWLVLSVFSLIFAVNNAQWITFGPVADEIKCYYGTTDFWINSLSIVYMAGYIVLVAFAVWALDRFGLRDVMIGSVMVLAVGSWLRVIGSAPSMFWILLVGQSITSIPCTMLWSAPSMLSSLWFPPSQRATATTIAGAMSAQIGIVISLALSPAIINIATQKGGVPTCSGQGIIQNRLFYYLSGQAIFATALIPLTLWGVPEAPPLPPSKSRQQQQQQSPRVARKQLIAHIVDILKNKAFVVFLIASSVMVASTGTIITLYEQVLDQHFSPTNQQILYVGIIVQLSGIVAMFVVGRWVDFSKSFHGTIVCVYLFTTLSMAALTVVIGYQKNFFWVYVAIALSGAGSNSFLGLCYEYGVELTYPIPEEVSAGLLNGVSQVFAIVLIEVVSMLSTKYSLSGMWLLTALGAMGAILTVFI
ncbi:hypothetical protein EMCRGX_G026188 [Ephydatia muelleri]